MKYIITRKFSFRNEKFRITRDGKRLCTARASLSKEYQGRYNVKLFNRFNKLTGENSCVVEPDSERRQTYLIYIRNDVTDKRTLAARFAYQLCSYGDYLYQFVIGQKEYQVRSSDLKDRRLALIDTLQVSTSLETGSPDTLFQMIDTFNKSNKEYHVTIDDEKRQHVYLAITILIDLHERRRNLMY